MPTKVCSKCEESYDYTVPQCPACGYLGYKLVEVNDGRSRDSRLTGGVGAPAVTASDLLRILWVFVGTLMVVSFFLVWGQAAFAATSYVGACAEIFRNWSAFIETFGPRGLAFLLPGVSALVVVAAPLLSGKDRIRAILVLAGGVIGALVCWQIHDYLSSVGSFLDLSGALGVGFKLFAATCIAAVIVGLSGTLILPPATVDASHCRLAPFEVADLPDKTKTFWQLVGPGAILVGLSIGSGELIMWPVIVATFGAGMIWAAAVGVFTQYWVNQELGRYTLATGESVYTGFARVWRGFAPLFILLNVAGWILPGWAVASGGALKALVVGTDGAGSSAMWTWITFALVALLLFGPKLIYSCVEKTEMILVAIVSVGLIVVAACVAKGSTWAEVGHGVLNFPHIDPKISMTQFFGALVFAGAGGTSNVFLNYYLRDKNLAMGARAEKVVNPLRGAEEKVPSTGFQCEPTEANLARWRQWFTHWRWDQAVFFWFLNTLTIMLFIVGALAVLRPRHLVPQGFEVAVTQAHILGEIIGKPGWYLMLIVAFATLFSTQLTLVDGCARTISDILYVNFEWAKKRSLSWWYAVIAGGWIVVGCLLAGLNFPPLLLLITGACMGGVAMAVYCPMTLYINHRFLPKEFRPGWVSKLFLGWASLLYGTFALYTLWQVAREAVKLLGG
ncbi:MAG: hypothetical protein COZ06_34645 [Armatimonadetes bacterium CG_4_10_14_3_um_filter_66_18]|nr:hypothetical protein [Armatimonadota bacterium]OIP02848.1 MAG: hypothetical protein AUJ96_15815 [Armatimonadetes bacterium CG2_30_66_41]PIU92424.1 MAG: hypothetical protein COS65_17970 [Armatimonadetes bacterium CG06_land_8_20_14_3_00_66_21]PIX44565.1 MAG: hypothetical protein COZ57_17230 [Armatimonadetes bacterium CG_4_8_14_3_um_filter_66_20]PIY36791.1 MAG: hypothetical protein COZ06_34645 [Armatimonadetes bacterium CG_4_10_14_3_um_filter_66_18]PIZ33579.1 MAG: hypothetical protein COY42_29